jgi:hypothetical protein
VAVAQGIEPQANDLDDGPVHERHQLRRDAATLGAAMSTTNRSASLCSPGLSLPQRDVPIQSDIDAAYGCESVDSRTPSLTKSSRSVWLWNSSALSVFTATCAGGI